MCDGGTEEGSPQTTCTGEKGRKGNREKGGNSEREKGRKRRKENEKSYHDNQAVIITISSYHSDRSPVYDVQKSSRISMEKTFYHHLDMEYNAK